ncbi:MAG: hypothetical protein QOJ65_87 [Fimbriimonadaceae bacterium]|jgi:Skp family chaperone for outer membrane proteins|nr:hypothetical protein [Fimbriimonadaceae bacterium]
MQRSNGKVKAKGDLIGWVVAAALAGVMVGSGFQGSTEKTGVVDLVKVMEASTSGKANAAQFDVLKGAREGLLKFIDENPVLTIEQAQKLHDITVKDNPTDADKAEMEKVKADAVVTAKRYQELAGKNNLTPEERTQLNEYSQRAQTMMGSTGTAQRWLMEFKEEMQDWADKHRADSLQRARTAVQQVAKAQGYSVVFESSIAPYGANDLTDAALQAMNAQK